MKVETEGLTALEALGVAIRAEADARDLYREMAERCEQPAVPVASSCWRPRRTGIATILVDKWQGGGRRAWT